MQFRVPWSRAPFHREDKGLEIDFITTCSHKTRASIHGSRITVGRRLVQCLSGSGQAEILEAKVSVLHTMHPEFVQSVTLSGHLSTSTIS